MTDKLIDKPIVSSVDDLVDMVENDVPASLKNTSTSRTVMISVASSLIAMLLVFALIKPIFELAWPLLKNSTGEHIGNIIDGYIKNASLGDRNWVVASQVISFRLIFLFSTIVISVSLTAKSVRTIKLSDKNNKKPVESKEKAKLEKNKKLLKLALIFLWFQLPFFAYTSIKSAGSIYYDIQLNASFSQRMNALAPLLSEQQEEDLRSMWALMVSRKDYDAINVKMETLATKGKLELPALLLE